MPKRKAQKNERRIFNILTNVNETIAQLYEDDEDCDDLWQQIEASVTEAAGVPTEPGSLGFRAKMLVLRQFFLQYRCNPHGVLFPQDGDVQTPYEADVLLMSIFRDLFGAISIRQPKSRSEP